MPDTTASSLLETSSQSMLATSSLETSYQSLLF